MRIIARNSWLFCITDIDTHYDFLRFTFGAILNDIFKNQSKYGKLQTITSKSNDYTNEEIQTKIEQMKQCIVKYDQFPQWLSGTVFESFMKLYIRNEIKCGNPQCLKKYVSDKYGINITIDISTFFNDNKYIHKKLITLHLIWKNRKIQNKWRLCKQCKMVKFCSKRCQKIAWNKYDHKQSCISIRDYLNK